VIEPAAWYRFNRSAPLLGFDHFWWGTDFRSKVECLAIEAVQHSKLGLADARRIREYGLEYGF
jgi:hypothetical protein